MKIYNCSTSAILRTKSSFKRKVIFRLMEGARLQLRRQNGLSMKTIKLGFVSVFILIITPWGSSLYKKPFIEDAWYGFSIARNIANGFGITIDGIQQTNGFQPLQVLIDTILFFLIKSDDATLVVIFICRIILHVLSAFVFTHIIRNIKRSSKSEKFYLFVFLAYLFNPAIISQAINGLETGLVLFLLLLLIRSLTMEYLHINSKTWKAKFTLCAIALIYARIDMLLIVCIVLIYLFIKQETRVAFQLGIFIIASIIPWLSWNYLKFGHLIPISGKQQQDPEFSIMRILHMLKAVTFNISPWLGAAYDQNNFALEALSFCLRILVLVWFVTILQKSLKTMQFEKSEVESCKVLGTISVAIFLLSLYYVFVTFATYFYPRYTVYFSPIFLLILFLLSKKPTKGEAITATSLLFVSIAVFLSGYHSTKSENALYESQVKLVNSTVPQSQLVGARQSGTLGYHRAKTVNLDGKVNPTAPTDIREMADYLIKERIDWLCDWPSLLLMVVDPHESHWVEISKNATVTCLKRTPTP